MTDVPTYQIHRGQKEKKTNDRLDIRLAKKGLATQLGQYILIAICHNQIKYSLSLLAFSLQKTVEEIVLGPINILLFFFFNFSILVSCSKSFTFCRSTYQTLLPPINTHVQDPSGHKHCDIPDKQSANLLEVPNSCVFNGKLVGEPNLAPAEIHAQLNFGFSGSNKPRTAVPNTRAPAETILITDASLNISFVICAISSLQYVLQTPLSPETLPDAL